LLNGTKNWITNGSSAYLHRNCPNGYWERA
jgi:hypothetical protein